ncbi:MAG TPA: 5'-nucleotidase C-terminal domain-containing protein [Thermoanaerobaculia bacterium]
MIAAAIAVTLLQFSDYHSHAVPFYAEEGAGRGGIARAAGYLASEKKRGALVFSGGDMVNKGSPAWSDKYRCVEWPWLNGIVDDMALGNHDPDYGAQELATCRKSIRYPILSANTAGFQPYDVLERKGVRIGVFAVAGSDFPALMKGSGFVFRDPVAAARETVRTLRDQEHVDAVVMIGHEHLQDDYALARAVPGIDLIFGSHSHLRRALTKIDGTNTWFMSPGQYLTDICRVELTFRGHKLTKVRGELVPVDAKMRTDTALAKTVDEMQRALEHDPQYAPLFAIAGTLEAPMSVDRLAHFAVARMRDAVHADVAVSTDSSFRQPLPRGAITLEQLRAALPYDNEIFLTEMRGDDLARLLASAGLIVDGVTAPEPSRLYRVATTDYMARTAAGYKDFFKDAAPSGKRVRDEVAKALRP